MEDFFHYLTKILAHRIMIHVYSLPNYSLETIIATVVCVVHFLLIMEVNSVVDNVLARYAVRLKFRPALREAEDSKFSLHSSTSKMRTPTRRHYDNKPCYMTYRKQGDLRTNSHLGWVIPPSTDEKYDKIDQILSITPSEYVRKDKEKRIHENELRNCLKSLTTLLECAVAQKFSDSGIEKDLSMIKEQLQTNVVKMDKDDEKQQPRKVHSDMTDVNDSLYNLMERTFIQGALINRNSSELVDEDDIKLNDLNISDLKEYDDEDLINLEID